MVTGMMLSLISTHTRILGTTLDFIKAIFSKGCHYSSETWFTNGQHSGFRQLFNGLLFILFKGASHQVPQAKRAAAFDMVKDAFAGHTDVWRMMEEHKFK